jgi:hypothetical protein
VSLSDNRTDRLYRDVLGWPIPAKPETPTAIVADLRAFLTERRRRREHRTPANKATTNHEGTHHA